MCIEAGRGTRGLIGHTQPRRLAAMTIARRISEELKESVGGLVGYKIRFDEKTSADTHIKVMTDGILLAEAQLDPYLRAYDTIIVDEAHERSLNIDFLLGILRSLLKKRHDLKLIITSATLDTKKISEAFGNAPIIRVSGRLYPVELRYRPLDPDKEEAGEITYIDATVMAVEEIERGSTGGDILIFMPTEQDIRETCSLLAGRKSRYGGDETILPLFARLTWAEQRRIFAPAATRKIVVATNVAETSITIPGIRYVIDTGLARISQYSTRTKTLSLPVTAISRSSADQRKGRCGRVEAGVCIRLYAADDYEKRALFTPPEILRSNLAEVILRMLSLNIRDIETFPFIDSPDARSFRDGLDTLKELGAIQSIRPLQDSPAEASRGKTNLALTDLGKRMAKLPIDPRIARMVIEAEKEGCLREVCVIAAALSVQDPREWPFDQVEAARKAHAPFQDPSSDFLTFLNIWNRYHENQENLKSQGRIRKFCKAHFISFKRMREWIDVHDQLVTILKESGEKSQPADAPLYARIHKAILSGYLSNIALRKEKNIYTAARGREVMIFPGSGLFNRGTDWLMAAEIVETTRSFARTTAMIEREWIEPLAKDLCRRTYSDAHWERKRGEVVAMEQVTLFGLAIVSRRPVSYGRIAPEEAGSIFVRSALVDGDLERPPHFLETNRELIEKISAMEDKLRRRDLLVDDEMLFAFYSERLPGVFDSRTLQKRIREQGGDRFLLLQEQDLLRRSPDFDALTHYPDEMSLGRLSFPLSYRFNPGATDDGITANIPYSLVGAVTPNTADWLVPGLQREKITLLIKALPKEFRKRLVPVATTVETILQEMPQGHAPLTSALSNFISRRFGVDIPVKTWPLKELPEYLQMRFSITDAKGKEIRSGRDIGALQQEISGDAASHAFDRAKKAWERGNITTWDFGDLPESILLEGPNGLEGLAYPALVDEALENSAEENHELHLRLFKNKQEADAAHQKGIRALFAMHFQKELRYLKKQQAFKGELKTATAYFGGEREVENNLYQRILRYLFPEPVRTSQDFFRYADNVTGADILSLGLKIAREVIPVIKAYADTRQMIRAMEKANQSNKAAQAFLAEIQNRLDTILPKHFILDYHEERFIHIPRYLKALEIRAERGLLHLAKDREKAEQIKVYENYYRALIESLDSDASGEKKKAVEDFRWMLEEYHVAVFAQRIKTAVPISPKRLEEKYREIDKMI